MLLLFPRQKCILEKPLFLKKDHNASPLVLVGEEGDGAQMVIFMGGRGSLGLFLSLVAAAWQQQPRNAPQKKKEEERDLWAGNFRWPKQGEGEKEEEEGPSFGK